jgi:hypothetical protein
VIKVQGNQAKVSPPYAPNDEKSIAIGVSSLYDPIYNLVYYCTWRDMSNLVKYELELVDLLLVY